MIASLLIVKIDHTIQDNCGHWGAFQGQNVATYLYFGGQNFSTYVDSMEICSIAILNININFFNSNFIKDIKMFDPA